MEFWSTTGREKGVCPLHIPLIPLFGSLLFFFLSRKFRILGLLGEVLDELGPTLFVAVATWAPGATNWAPADWAPG